MGYLKDHWYWVLGIVIGLWVLMRMVGSKASAGANVSTPGGSQIIYGGTNANDAAVQAAQINAQTQLAGSQIAANQAAQLAQYATQANADTQSANVQIAQYSTTAAVAMNRDTQAANVQLGQYNAAANVQIAGAQAARDVNIAQYQGMYGLAMTNSNNAAAMHVSDNATLLGVNSNQTNLQEVQNTNAAKLAAYNIQAGVINTQTNAYRDVAMNAQNNNAAVQQSALSDATQIASQQLSNQSALQQMTYQLEVSGTLNKGGSGGTSQLAAWNALINPASAASGDAAVAQVATAQATSTAAIIGAIGSAVTNFAAAIF